MKSMFPIKTKSVTIFNSIKQLVSLATVGLATTDEIHES
jgi:hypothetical protein